MDAAFKRHVGKKKKAIHFWSFSLPPFEASSQSLISIFPQTFRKSPDNSIVLNINGTQHNALFIDFTKCWIVLFYI